MSGPFAEGGPLPPAPSTTMDDLFPPRQKPTAGPAATHPYPLDNDDPLAASHHSCLSTLLDPFSRRRTLELFAPDGGLHGKRCLDVGAGVGAHYARWLAEQVGPAGLVVALDVKPREVPTHPQLSVVEHDLNSTTSLGQDWDFIHARLTLGHLPSRRDILRQLAGNLKPGGRILIEDWDASRTGMVLAAPSLEAAERYTIVQETVGRLFATAGTDRTWARRIHAALLADGLTDVHTVIHAESWTGGGPGAHLAAITIDELRPALLAAGMLDDHLDQVQHLLSDPRLVLAGHLLYSTSGQRPDQ